MASEERLNQGRAAASLRGSPLTNTCGTNPARRMAATAEAPLPSMRCASTIIRSGLHRTAAATAPASVASIAQTSCPIATSRSANSMAMMASSSTRRTRSAGIGSFAAKSGLSEIASCSSLHGPHFRLARCNFMPSLPAACDGPEVPYRQSAARVVRTQPQVTAGIHRKQCGCASNNEQKDGPCELSAKHISSVAPNVAEHRPPKTGSENTQRLRRQGAVCGVGRWVTPN